MDAQSRLAAGISALDTLILMGAQVSTIVSGHPIGMRPEVLMDTGVTHGPEVRPAPVGHPVKGTGGARIV